MTTILGGGESVFGGGGAAPFMAKLTGGVAVAFMMTSLGARADSGPDQPPGRGAPLDADPAGPDAVPAPTTRSARRLGDDDMYAVIRISGFQSLVKEGDIVTVPLQQAEPGAKVPVEVLFVRTDDATHIGTPVLANAGVEVEVVDHFRADKVRTFKFIRRENYHPKSGHRQHLTRVKIGRITAGA